MPSVASSTREFIAVLAKLEAEQRLFAAWLDGSSVGGDAGGLSRDVRVALRNVFAVRAAGKRAPTLDDLGPRVTLASVADAEAAIEQHVTLVRSLLQLCDGSLVPALRSAGGAQANRELLARFGAVRDALRQSLVAAGERLAGPAHVARQLLGECEAPVVTDVERAVDVGRVPRQREAQGDDDDDGTAGEKELLLAAGDIDTHDRERLEAMRQLAEDARELREIQELAARLAVEQDAGVDAAAENAETAAARAVAARQQLTKAARYKVVGAALTGALVGGVIGGPVGMYAGAKSAAAIALGVGIGTVTGGVAANAVAAATVARATEAEDPPQ